MMMPRKQHMHDTNPESSLGKGNDNGEQRHVLGEGSDADNLFNNIGETQNIYDKYDIFGKLLCIDKKESFINNMKTFTLGKKMEVFIQSRDESILQQDIVTPQEHGVLVHAEQAGSSPNGLCNSGESNLEYAVDANVSREVFGAPDPLIHSQQSCIVHDVASIPAVVASGATDFFSAPEHAAHHGLPSQMSMSPLQPTDAINNFYENLQAWENRTYFKTQFSKNTTCNYKKANSKL